MYEQLPDGYHFVRSTGAHASAHGYETTSRYAGHLAELLSQGIGPVAGASWAADAPAALGTVGRGVAKPCQLVVPNAMRLNCLKVSD